MTKTIFRNTFLVGISVLLLCGLLFFAMQYRQTEDEAYDTLQQEAGFAEKGLMLSGVEYLKEIGDLTRVTWIDADGEVMFDNEFASGLPNQKDCKEVAQAFAQKEGQSIRKSESKGNTCIYYAILCEDGNVLRLSKPLSAVRDAFDTVSPVLWMVVLVLLISGILAFRAARQIVDPINSIDLEHPDETIYPELTPLVNKIVEQRLTIQEETIIREQMRKEFTSNMSYELKTPLTTISEYAERIEQGEADADQIQGYTKEIRGESQRLMTMIDDIIELTQLDEKPVGTATEKVNLYEICCNVADVMKPIADQSTVSLEVKGEQGEDACVTGDSQLLKEMLYNLCDNAIKYNRKGGKVTFSVTPEAEQIRLSVADTGIGISPEHQKRVFERFYRVDKSHTREVGDTGLGLSIVKHGAKFHGAKVELESEEGVGTTISILFPKTGEEQA